MSYKQCKGCFENKELEEYSLISRQKGNGSNLKPIHRRNFCRKCHCTTLHQRLLSKKFDNNVKGVYQCDCARYYSDIKNIRGICPTCKKDKE